MNTGREGPAVFTLGTCRDAERKTDRQQFTGEFDNGPQSVVGILEREFLSIQTGGRLQLHIRQPARGKETVLQSGLFNEITILEERRVLLLCVRMETGSLVRKRKAGVAAVEKRHRTDGHVAVKIKQLSQRKLT